MDHDGSIWSSKGMNRMQALSAELEFKFNAQFPSCYQQNTISVQSMHQQCCRTSIILINISNIFIFSLARVLIGGCWQGSSHSDMAQLARRRLDRKMLIYDLNGALSLSCQHGKEKAQHYNGDWSGARGKQWVRRNDETAEFVPPLNHRISWLVKKNLY